MGLPLNCSRGFAFSRWAKKQAALQWTAFPAVDGAEPDQSGEILQTVSAETMESPYRQTRVRGHQWFFHDEARQTAGLCIYGAWEVVGRFYV